MKQTLLSEQWFFHAIISSIIDNKESNSESYKIVDKYLVMMTMRNYASLFCSPDPIMLERCYCHHLASIVVAKYYCVLLINYYHYKNFYKESFNDFGHIPNLWIICIAGQYCCLKYMKISRKLFFFFKIIAPISIHLIFFIKW